MSAPADSYDELPYEDIAYYHTHPSNLAVVAILCGLEPPPVANCRVLDLGCGTGFNLIAMAHSLPGATLVGVERSRRQVELGRALAAAVGAKNVELRAADIDDLGDSPGAFDYVICHGVFSWVPDRVREAVLAACQRCLAPGGIAYVSYNTFPGWHARAVLRDAFQSLAPPGPPPRERVRQARAAVDRLLAELPEPESNYARLLRAEYEGVRNDPEAYLFHEYLEDDNRPLRFEEFVGMATGAGLRFLAEARFGTNSFVQHGAVARALAGVPDDLLRREQYLDFLRNRSFRQSLLCHDGVQPPWAPSLRAVGGLSIRGRIEPLGTGEGGVEEFRVAGGPVVRTPDPVVRGILHALTRVWPRAVTVAELADVAVAAVGSAAFPAGAPPDVLVRAKVIGGYIEGLWELYAFAPPFAAEVGERPRACPLARHLAHHGLAVTNRLHSPAEMPDGDRAVLRRLDGETTREQLRDALGITTEALDGSLARLAAVAVLV